MALNPSQYPALKNELTNDPAGLGYAGKTASEASVLMNAVPANVSNANLRLQRDRVETWEIVEATSPTEYDALSAAEKERYARLTGLGTLNPRGSNIQGAFLRMFGAGTATRTALALLQWRPASRSEVLFGGSERVEPWDIERARSL